MGMIVGGKLARGKMPLPGVLEERIVDVARNPRARRPGALGGTHARSNPWIWERFEMTCSTSGLRRVQWKPLMIHRQGAKIGGMAIGFGDLT